MKTTINYKLFMLEAKTKQTKENELIKKRLLEMRLGKGNLFINDLYLLLV